LTASLSTVWQQLSVLTATTEATVSKDKWKPKTSEIKALTCCYVTVHFRYTRHFCCELRIGQDACLQDDLPNVPYKYILLKPSNYYSVVCVPLCNSLSYQQ